MTVLRSLFAAVALAGVTPAALATDVNVTIAGEVRPGVYGRVEIGNNTPPPLVYARPVTIVRPPPQAVIVEPVYLHVPPGHARNWRKHCRRYDACGRPVYFVKSAEYEPRREHRGHGNGKHD